MLNKIIEIVKEASKIMLQDDHFDVAEKDGVTNIVTTNDIRVQDFLQSKLSELLPNSSFFCEENNVKDLSKEYIWIIDPIDGTTNYSRHIPVCSIAVALEHEGEVVIGVVYNPYQNAMYYAEKGKGAFLNGKPIHVSDKKFNECIYYTAFGQYNKAHSNQIFDFQKIIYPLINDIRRTASAAFEISSIGSGRGDLFFEERLSTWDYAAASRIIQEAGGYICSIDGKLQFDDGCLIVAANTKENLDKLLSLVRQYFK